MENIRQLKPDYAKVSLHNLYQKMMELEHQILRLTNPQPTICIHSQEGKDIIPVHTILRVESDNNYAHIYLEDGTHICVSKTLKYIQQQLPTHLFIRIHASHLVRRDTIRKISYGSRKTIHLVDSSEIPVSRTYASQVESIFQNV